MKVVYIGVSSKYVHTMPAGWFIAEALKQSGVSVAEMYHNVNEDYRAVKESVHAQAADFYLLSAYIFNASFVKKLIADIRAALPHSVTVVGGPEADESYGADYLVVGEGERAILPILQGKENKRIIVADKIETLDDLPSPYTEERIKASQNKLIYYESTRGCPFCCTYCAAGTTRGVRAFSLSRVFSDLLTIGKSEHVRTVKFTDRTFNADNIRAEKIIAFIKETFSGSKLCFHFEVGGDLFSDSLLSLLESLPHGLIQLEAGVQTLNPYSLKAISRPFCEERFIKNIQRIREKNNVHLHLDLIAGLPHDTLLTFKESFDRVIPLRPHKLQLGFLKMLKGTPIRESYKAVFGNNPPYEVTKTETMTEEDFKELKSVEKALDKLYNSGRFIHFLTALFEDGSPYERFLVASRRLEEENAYARGENAVYAALLSLYENMPHARELLLFDYLLTNNSRVVPHALKAEPSQVLTEYLKSVPRDGKSYYAFFRYHPVTKTEGNFILFFDYTVRNPVDGTYAFQTVSP